MNLCEYMFLYNNVIYNWYFLREVNCLFHFYFYSVTVIIKSVICSSKETELHCELLWHHNPVNVTSIGKCLH